MATYGDIYDGIYVVCGFWLLLVLVKLVAIVTYQ